MDSFSDFICLELLKHIVSRDLTVFSILKMLELVSNHDKYKYCAFEIKAYNIKTKVIDIYLQINLEIMHKKSKFNVLFAINY